MGTMTALRPFEPTPWMEHPDRGCKNYTPDDFHPLQGNQPGGPAGLTINQLKNICHTCPVEMECRTYAVQRPDLLGVWGGSSENERRNWRNGRTRRRPRIRKHGTITGYQQHRERNETPCPACTSAHNRTRRRRQPDPLPDVPTPATPPRTGTPLEQCPHCRRWCQPYHNCQHPLNEGAA